MKRILIICLTFSLASFIQYGISQTEKNNYSKSDWKIFEQPFFSVKYPKDWELNTSGQMRTSFILFAPLESNNDLFKENINLIVQDLTGHKIDLNKFTEVSESQIKTVIPHSSLIESKRIKNGNEEYHKLIYTGDQGTFHLKYEQYYWIVNQRSYILTFTTELSKYELYKAKGEKILQSFVIKNK